jgi:hypothetical protein
LAARPASFYEHGEQPTLWSKPPTTDTAAYSEAVDYKKKYEADVQFIFSRVQHHWHDTDKDGIQ